ncbi:MAG: aminotransferase class I/II-fold pyridoxal phosphate-dependent enzyme [Alphaproteobacteria bacterium]|nr:aminotransferase class I/II-fold pyridoxal phosphate-dependent enzyme [Alphaproteobacteria bacterium]
MTAIQGLSASDKRALLEALDAEAAEGPSAPARPDPSTWREVRVLRSRLDVVSGWAGEVPFFREHPARAGATSHVAGREVIHFGSYDYLGLCGHPCVSEAAVEAVARYGTSPSASRVASGQRTLHRELEEALAALHGVDAALAMVSGHATNVSVLGQLVGPRDLVVADELVHNSILEGVRLAGATLRLHRHLDLDHLSLLLRALRRRARRVLVVTEGVFSMDGDAPDLVGLLEVVRRHGALLMVDEAHSIGVLGETGRGLAEHAGVDPREVDLWMGTLSKAFAGCGGYVAGSAALIDWLRYTVPGFVYSVGMSPPVAAASLAAIGVLREEPERVRRLMRNARAFRDGARAAGLDTGSSSAGAVVPVITGSSYRSIKLSDALLREGINVDAAIAPAVPQGGARLRFFLTAAHTPAQIERTLSVLAEQIQRLPARRSLDGVALAALPGVDAVTLGRLTDPGTVGLRKARTEGYDPDREAARATLLRTAYAGGLLEVPIAGPMGRWPHLSAWRADRASRGLELPYVLPHGDDVVVVGTATDAAGPRPFLHRVRFGPDGPSSVDEVVDLPSPGGEERRAGTLALYDLFMARADIGAFLGRCTEDVDWRVPGPAALPFTGAWRGPEAVLAFWQALASVMDVHEHWVDHTFVDGDHVWVVGGFRSTAIETGLAYADPFVHRATWRDGRLSAFREFFDACVTLAAYRPELCTGT